MFTNSTLQDSECIEGEAPGHSEVALVLDQQTTLKWEVDDHAAILNTKEVEVSTLKSELQKVISTRPDTGPGNEEVLSSLKDENDLLKSINASLSEEIQT